MTDLEKKIINEYYILKDKLCGSSTFELTEKECGMYATTLDFLLNRKCIGKQFSDNRFIYRIGTRFNYFEENYRAEIGEPLPKLFSLLNDLEILRSNFISVGGNGMPIIKTIHTNPDFIKWKNSVGYELQKLLPNKVINDCNSILNLFNGWNDVKLFEEIKAKLEIIVENYDEFIESEGISMPNNSGTYDKIFISHKSSDKKFGDALAKLLREIGLDDEQIIYTSSPRHKIPLNQDFSEYLRNNINERIYAIYLFSESYLQSPICMNEMGAFWVKQSDYTNTFIPDFDFSNPNFVSCVSNNKKIGFSFNCEAISIANLIELKDKIVSSFNLKPISSVKWENILDEYKEAIR